MSSQKTPGSLCSHLMPYGEDVYRCSIAAEEEACSFLRGRCTLLQSWEYWNKILGTIRKERCRKWILTTNVFPILWFFKYKTSLFCNICIPLNVKFNKEPIRLRWFWCHGSLGKQTENASGRQNWSRRTTNHSWLGFKPYPWTIAFLCFSTFCVCLFPDWPWRGIPNHFWFDAAPFRSRFVQINS